MLLLDFRTILEEALTFCQLVMQIQKFRSNKLQIAQKTRLNVIFHKSWVMLIIKTLTKQFKFKMVLTFPIKFSK